MKENITLSYDLNTVKAVFERMDNEKSQVGLAQLEEVMFLKESCKRLRKEIEKNEVMREFQQGNYSINVVNPAMKSYNTTYKNFESAVKSLIKMLPEQYLKGEYDDFDEFNK